jgi:Dolichyl-phosphate-mannose-protein mannosyltransferase
MRVERVLFSVLLALAGAYGLTLLVVISLRIGWGFEIEWMEGGELSHALRLATGRGIYVAPSADFVPFFYTPLYPAVLAGLAKLGLPLGFPLGRAVSALATFATMGMLYAIGAREAGRVWGVLAACLYASLFRFAGAFYDVARPDAFELALVLGAALVARRSLRSHGAALAGVLLCAAFLTKQTAAVFGPPIALCLFVRDRRLGVVFAVVAAGLGALATWLLTRATGGWFWFYVFEGHQGHRFIWENILHEYWRDVLFLAPMLLLFPLFAISYGRLSRWVALVLGLGLAVAFVERARTLDYPEHMYYRELWYESPRALILLPPLALAALLGGARLVSKRIDAVPGYWLVMAASGALASGLNHSTQWAYANCFMPIAVFGSLAVAFAVKSVSGDTEGRRSWVPALVSAALIVQFVALAYNPLAQVPRAEDRKALALLKRRVAEMQGPVFIPSHPFLAYEMSGRMSLHQMGIGDVAFSGGIPDLAQRLGRGEWPTVVVDDEVEVPDLEPSFYVSEELPYDGQELYPKTGFRVRPLTVWRRQDRTERDLALGVSGNFEGGAYRGWTSSGETFGTRPAVRNRLGQLEGLEGASAASSRFSSGAGTLVSAPFVLDKPRITVLVAGALGSYVRAMSGEEEIARVQPVDTKTLAPKSLELDRWVGQTIRLEIVDEDSASRGPAHLGIVVDDLRSVL